MGHISRLIGTAGSGKTTALIDMIGEVAQRGFGALDIGFVSFTRSARLEAAQRAESVLGMSSEHLMTRGWFKTIHAVCYHAIGVGKDALLTGNKATSEWFQQELNAPVAFDTDGNVSGETPHGRVIKAWSVARAKMVPIKELYPSMSSWDLAFLDRFESAKRIDGRLDFTDIIAQFAGYMFDAAVGPYRIDPVGDVPNVPVWFHDEMQDASKLLGQCFGRLIENADLVYLAGDPFQSIHTHGGADPSIFMSWPVDEQTIMPKTWRCREKVYELGERCLTTCSDYFDRGVKSVKDGGEIIKATLSPSLVSSIDPRESWLILARTNRQARQLINMFKNVGPWFGLKVGAWMSEKLVNDLFCFHELAKGNAITAGEWHSVIKRYKVKYEGEAIFKRGYKSEWKDAVPQGLAGSMAVIEELGEWGATDYLIELIKYRRISVIEPRAEEFARFLDEFGAECLMFPSVGIGNIHSSKGMEADNVLIVTSVGQIVHKTMTETAEGRDAEQRLAYVAVTRAKDKVILAREPGSRFEMGFPA